MPAYFGLDIGSTSIKLVEIDGKRVKTIGIGTNTFGKNVVMMTNTEKISLTDSLKSLLKEVGMRGKKVVVSIPESLVFSKVLQFPVMSTPELSTAIKWELDQSVPFPPKDVETSWIILDKPDKLVGDEKISVYVVAVPTNVSETYVQMMELIDLEPVRLENEIPALTRAFMDKFDGTDPAMIVDLGASGTNIVTAGKERIFNNYYIPVGGSAMTRLIADAFGLPLDQAESYKRTYGLAKDQLEGKILTTLKPVIDNLVGEIRKMMISYKDTHPDSNVKKLVLTGGGAYLVGLIPYLTEQLSEMEVVMGDLFVDLAVDNKYKGLGPVFAVSCGLAQ